MSTDDNHDIVVGVQELLFCKSPEEVCAVILYSRCGEPTTARRVYVLSGVFAR